jgi:hypothetical protein
MYHGDPNKTVYNLSRPKGNCVVPNCDKEIRIPKMRMCMNHYAGYMREVKRAKKALFVAEFANKD